MRKKKNNNLTNILSHYGFKNIIFSTDTLILLFFTVITIYLINKLEFNDPITLAYQFSLVTVAIGIGLLGVVITTLSILISMFSGEFWIKVQESNSYLGFCTPFILNCINWIILIITSLLILILTNIVGTIKVLILLVSISTGILIAGLKGLIDLMIITIKINIYKNVINK